MNRSTTLYIAVATLVLGSGTSFFAFVQPALTEQAKLKTQKAGLESQKTSLTVQVKDLEGKAANAAMLDIAFFDLRTSQNQRRELETKTVQTLASLTEIFNDNKIRVQELAPTGETVGLNKPVPSAAPSGGSPAPGESPAPGTAAVATPVPGTPTTPPPISLTHKAFKLKVRGEYANLVKAMNEIQGLPKAISVSQYNLQLLDKGQDTPAAPAPGEQKAPGESPTALEMGFHVSITFLMAGGSPVAAPSPGAVPVGQAPAPVTDLLSFAEWILGGAAHAAVDAAPLPQTPAVAVAPAAQPAVVPATARYRLNGVVAENGGLRLVTAGGTPPYTLVGITRNKAVLELSNTSLAPGVTASAAPGGAIVDVRVVANKPGVVRVVVETDGSKRLLAQLDRAERLRLVPAAWNAPVARVASAHQPIAQSKPAAQRHAAAPAGGLTRVEGVSVDGDEIVIQTSGGAPRFTTLGGTKTRLDVQLEHAGVKPAVGRVFPVGAHGIKQVRAVLYKNRPMTTRLAIDTDGSVRLTAYAGADGKLRIRAAGTGAKPVAAPVAAKPAAQAPKPAAVAAAPGAPTATPTPMAVPVAKKPVAKPNQPAPKASTFPESAANIADGPHLQRSLSSSYAFPIERERVTGRSNPFKVLPNRAKPKPVADVPVPPQPIGQVPSLPMPGMGVVNAPPAVPKAPAAPAKTYAVTAVIMGGGQPPVAAIKVDGKTHMVGLNDTLPGNARVKSIHADHVVLTSFNQDIRVGLKK
ncbi:hypothetical protein D3C72_766650 [compost metagenome]